MVNNLDANKEIGKDAMSSGSDDNGTNNFLAGCDSNDDTNAEKPAHSYVRRRKCNENVQICEKKKKRESYRRISSILRKNETERTAEEIKQLETNGDIVKLINKRRENIAETRERVLEKEDPPDVIEAKAKKLADVLSRAQHLVCYTGAGISTSARIPDYRGSQGIWTLLQQGKEIGQHDLSLAEPTFTHMSLYELHRRNILRYTLSQNCDGLHLRSGLPKKLLSEIHGNMYIEVCKHCKPNVEYWRLFDTTELTARYYHKTNRRCHFCFKPLIDTIVHFGERGRLKWPLNWESACKHAEKADVILCLGSSLKVLKKYAWLWQMDRPKNKRPKIYIVNLQWTPKDKNASLKINGKCDEVMKLVMDYMGIKVTQYNRTKDPIFAHASLLATEEMHTVSQPMLKHYSQTENDEKDGCDEIKAEKEENGEENSIEEATEDHLQANTGCETHNNSNIEKTGGVRQVTEKPIASSNAAVVNSEIVPVEQPKLLLSGPKFTSNGNENLKNHETKNETQLTEKDTTISDQLEMKDCTSTATNLIVPNLPQRNNITASNQSQDSNAISTESNDIEQTSIKQEPIENDQSKDNNITKDPMPVDMSKKELNKQSEDALAAKAKPSKQISANIFQNGTDGDEKREEEYYKSLISYYRAIEGVLPHWYDVNYAYSGLHSIIHPPPNEVDIWSTVIIPIFQLNRNLAECEFCFDNYAEDKCQFYQSTQNFHVSDVKRRNGKRILCECCDFDDGGKNEDSEMADDQDEEMDCSEEQKTNSDDEESDVKEAKRIKRNRSTSSTGNEASTKVIQPGWYGKGYRKTTKRRKHRRSYQLP